MNTAKLSRQETWIEHCSLFIPLFEQKFSDKRGIKRLFRRYVNKKRGAERQRVQTHWHRDGRSFGVGRFFVQLYDRGTRNPRLNPWLNPRLNPWLEPRLNPWLRCQNCCRWTSPGPNPGSSPGY